MNREFYIRNSLFSLTLLLSAICFYEAFLFLFEKWSDIDHGAYNHGFLLLAIALYFFFRQPQKKQEIGNDYSNIGLIFSIFLIVGIFFFNTIHIVAAEILLLYFLLTSLLVSFYGFSLAKRAIFSFGMILFALPIWDEFGPILQYWTTQMAYLMVKISGLPIVKEGNLLHVPAGVFEVASSCSGLSYFLAAASLAVIYSYQYRHSKKDMAIVIGSIIFASVVSNWIRVFIIVIVGQMTDMQHSLVEDHFSLGWVVFGAFFIILVLVFNRVLHVEAARCDEVVAQSYVNETNGYNPIKLAVLPFVLLFIAVFSFLGNERANDGSLGADIIIPEAFFESNNFPALGGRWPGETKKYYKDVRQGAVVYLYHGLITHQTQGNEIVSSSPKLIDTDRWLIVDSGEWKVGNGSSVIRFLVQSKLDGAYYTVWQWYKVSGINTSSKLMAKLYEFLGVLRGDNSGAFVVLVAQTKLADNLLSVVYLEISGASTF